MTDPGRRSAGRPREFDKETALVAATHQFWSTGYHATSLSDLCKCTGLHKGSLYQAFGSKHQLFVSCLNHYIDTVFAVGVIDAPQAASPLVRIKRNVDLIWAHANSEHGCFLCNTLVELGAHDEEVRAIVRTSVNRRLQTIADLVGEAQDCREIDKALPPEGLARQFGLMIVGAMVQVKCLSTLDEAKNQILETIDSWKLTQ